MPFVCSSFGPSFVVAAVVRARLWVHWLRAFQGIELLGGNLADRECDSQSVDSSMLLATASSDSTAGILVCMNCPGFHAPLSIVLSVVLGWAFSVSFACAAGGDGVNGDSVCGV